MGEGSSATYTVQLATQPREAVTVTVSGIASSVTVTTDSSTAGQPDQLATTTSPPPSSISLGFTAANWNQPQNVTITVPRHYAAIDNNTLTLRHSASGADYEGVSGEVMVTITAAAETTAPQAWLARLGRTVSQDVVDAIRGRFAITRQPGLQLTVAGEELTSAPPLAQNQQVLAKVLGFETVSAQQLVEGSSFTFSPTVAADHPAPFSIWGQGIVSSFSGKEQLALSGDVTTALVGAEWSTGRWLAGAALSRSWASGSYGVDNDSDADINTSLTGLFPYGRYGITPRLGIWATLGYGWGTLSLQPDGDGREYKANTTLRMAAVGMDGLLLDGGADGLSLTSTADALLVQTTSEASDGLAASDAHITRLRLGLEATRPVPLANGAALLPSLELGIRQDSGDAETGFGMELGAGIAWADTGRGISAELTGRTMLTHSEEHFQEQGLAVSFAWEPNPTNRGPSLALSHSIGAAADGGMDALLSPTAMEVLDTTPSKQHQFETKLAYGFPAFNDRLTFTPGLGLVLASDSTTTSLLWTLAPYRQQSQAQSWQLSLEHQQQDSNSSTTLEHSLEFTFSLLF